MADIDKIKFYVGKKEVFEIEKLPIKTQPFISPSKGKMDLSRVISEIHAYFEEDAKSAYKIIVGTDSNSSAEPEFVSAIVVQRIGRGGIYFYRKHNGVRVHSLRDKIYFEVNDSLELARELAARLRERLGDLALDFGPEIHIDVGEYGPTRDVIKEVVATVLSSGFGVKYKPESFAATSVADKHT